ncbi:hypothetical protein D3C78_1140710 [compost metagenome]
MLPEQGCQQYRRGSNAIVVVQLHRNDDAEVHRIAEVVACLRQLSDNLDERAGRGIQRHNGPGDSFRLHAAVVTERNDCHAIPANVSCPQGGLPPSGRQDGRCAAVRGLRVGLPTRLLHLRLARHAVHADMPQRKAHWFVDALDHQHAVHAEHEDLRTNHPALVGSLAGSQGVHRTAAIRADDERLQRRILRAVPRTVHAGDQHHPLVGVIVGSRYDGHADAGHRMDAIRLLVILVRPARRAQLGVRVFGRRNQHGPLVRQRVGWTGNLIRAP